MRIHFCQVSDSFVKGINKLAHGKNGHGERRLYISASHDIQRRLVAKKWKLDFDVNYVKEIEHFLDDPTKFVKVRPTRKAQFIKNIRQIHHAHVIPLKQDGDDDVRRKYIGPHKEKNNMDLWDKWRETLIPTITTLEFHEDE